MSEFHGILFDLDGVLIDSMSAHAEAWVTACARCGIEISEDEIYRREGEKLERSARDFLKIAGIMSTKARIREMIRIKEEIYAGKGIPKLFPGAIEVVGAFRDADLKTAIVTGSTRGEVERVLPPELMELADVIVCGDEVMRGKPHPEPYLAAMMKLSIKPQESIAVENAPFGIESAKTAGAHVIAVRSYLGDDDLRDAHELVNDIRQIPPLVLGT